jgi:hypothetical protein
MLSAGAFGTIHAKGRRYMDNRAMVESRAVEYLLGLIRAGSYTWVAARAAGIDDDTLQGMLESRSSLRGEIHQAQAQARARAEIELKEKNALAWLRYGPGRPSRDGAGWTGAARAVWDTADDVAGWRRHVQDIVVILNEFCEAHPECRAELADIIDRKLGPRW